MINHQIMGKIFLIVFPLILNMVLPLKAQQQRARDLGINIGVLPSGQNNAITDVSGVKLGSINAVVGETNDGYLNDIRGRHVKSIHVQSAIESAQTGPIEEGAVGAGTGTVCFGCNKTQKIILSHIL